MISASASAPIALRVLLICVPSFLLCLLLVLIPVVLPAVGGDGGQVPAPAAGLAALVGPSADALARRHLGGTPAPVGSLAALGAEAPPASAPVVRVLAVGPAARPSVVHGITPPS